MIYIGSENVIHTMSKSNAPSRFCESGDIVTFHTLDCFCNKLLPETACFGVDNPRLNNPATGPLYVKGATPEDTLKVEILDIAVGKLGVSLIGPSSESLRNRLDQYKIRRIPIKAGRARLTESLELPIKPMIGVIGVAAAEAGIPTGMAGKHGGNMDCSQIKKGAILYLPVFQDGALLAIGDLHALMGDGEIAEGGLEIEGTVTIRVSILNGVKRTAPALLVDEKWITIATCKTLDEAAEAATDMMLGFLIDQVGMNAYDASLILSLTGNLVVCQKCDYYNTIRMELSCDCFAHTGYVIP